MTKQTGCCKECRCPWNHGVLGYSPCFNCHNPTCSCHDPSIAEWRRRHPERHTEHSESWEDRFDDKFPPTSVIGITLGAELKSFIRTLLSSREATARKEERERIIGAIDPRRTGNTKPYKEGENALSKENKHGLNACAQYLFEQAVKEARSNNI